MKNSHLSDPYQWFFPLGIVLGIIGTFVWILFWHNPLTGYPGVKHAEVMIGGFVLTIATGFLMTAIPKFTGTPPASRYEVACSFLVTLGLLGSAFFVQRFWFHGCLLLNLVALIRFGLSRFRKKTTIIPASFMLVGFGLLSALSGTTLLLINDIVPLSQPLWVLARLFLWYGTTLGFALGIGSRLIPAITGLAAPIMHAVSCGPVLRSEIVLFATTTALLLLAFIVEATLHFTTGRLLRALVVTFLLFTTWRIWSRPKSPGFLSWSLWIAAWMMPIGMWVPLISPTYAVHAAHIFFMGSLSIMIFAIASRVTLAHGGFDVRIEWRSKGILLMVIFMISALATRLAAPFMQQYVSHLAYASLLWIIAVMVWSIAYLPRILHRQGGK